MKDFASQVEASRVDVKGPVLEWGRTIDGLAKNLLAPLDSEQARLKKLMNTYAAAKQKLAEEAERKRLAELKRIADDQAKIAKEKADADAAAANALTAEEQSKAEEQKRIAEQKQRESQQAAAKVSVAVAVPNVEGVSVKKVWRHEVVNIHHLYTNNPKLCRIEPNTNAINESIRNGARDIPGLRIWEEIDTNVR